MVEKRGQNFHEFSGLFLALGILMVVFGVLLMVFPVVGTFAVEILFGIALLIIGIIGIVVGALSRHFKGSIWILLNGIIGVIIGGVLLFFPWEGVIALTLLISIVLIAQGIFEMVRSFELKKKFWRRAILVDGILCFLIGILVLIGWPLDAVWVIGILLGVGLFITGIFSIFFSREVKKAGL